MNKENCALKLVDEIILYYDARPKKHQITFYYAWLILIGYMFRPYMRVIFRPLHKCVLKMLLIYVKA